MRLKVKQHLCVLTKRLSQVFLLLASVVAGKYTEPPGLKSRHVLRPARLGRGEALDIVTSPETKVQLWWNYNLESCRASL